MPAPRRVKGFSKKAVRALNKRRRTPTTKLYGKAVMKDDPDKPGRRIGYATTAETELPKFKPRKLTTKGGRRSLRQAKK